MDVGETAPMKWIRQGSLALMLVIMLALETLPLVGAQDSTPAATPTVGTPVASPAASPVPSTDETTRDPNVTDAEQALADKWVPVARLRAQAQDCSTEGEPYIPISVDITLNNPDVLLRKRIAGAPSADDPIIMTGPSAADLVGLDSTYYLDLPGDSLDPGCVYETWSRQRIEELGLTPSVYAHIASEPGRPGKLAVQYWFYYAFDSFNNSHESDWEMIQLTFDAYTAEEALALDAPSLVSFAQHSGGENALWDDSNVVYTDDGRIVSFPAQGSHASYFDSAIWLAWGEHGAGFGCDQSQVELVEVPLKAIVVPNVVDIHGEFAWTLFQGRWGEYHPWQFNAPVSPNLTAKWRHPISWTDNLRSVSYAVPHHDTFGVGPGEFFCAASTLGGDLAKRVQVAPQVIGAGVLAVFIGILFASFLTWRFIKQAAGIYVRHSRHFVPATVLVLGIAALAARLRDFGIQTVIGDWLDFDPDTEATMTSFFTRGGVSTVLFYLLMILAVPWIVAITGAILRNEPVHLWSTLALALRKIPVVIGALVLNAILVFLMLVTVILIPFGIYRQVQWFYSPHAIMLDGAGIRSARKTSRNAIKGDWVRTFGMSMVISILSGIPGPLIGMGLVLTNRVSLQTAGLVSSIVFAIVYTIAIIASTIYYRWRQENQAERVAEGLTATEGEQIRRKLRFWEEEDEAGESGAAPPSSTPRPEPA